MTTIPLSGFKPHHNHGQRPITRFRCPWCKREFIIPYDFRNPRRIKCGNCTKEWKPTAADVVAKERDDE